MLLVEGVCYDQCSLFTKLLSFCTPNENPVSFCIPRPNLPVIPGISCLPTFALQFPMMKRASLFGVNSRRSCRSS